MSEDNTTFVSHAPAPHTVLNPRASGRITRPTASNPRRACRTVRARHPKPRSRPQPLPRPRTRARSRSRSPQSRPQAALRLPQPRWAPLMRSSPRQMAPPSPPPPRTRSCRQRGSGSEGQAQRSPRSAHGQPAPRGPPRRRRRRRRRQCARARHAASRLRVSVRPPATDASRHPPTQRQPPRPHRWFERPPTAWG